MVCSTAGQGVGPGSRLSLELVGVTARPAPNALCLPFSSTKAVSSRTARNGPAAAEAVEARLRPSQRLGGAGEAQPQPLPGPRVQVLVPGFELGAKEKTARLSREGAATPFPTC